MLRAECMSDAAASHGKETKTTSIYIFHFFLGSPVTVSVAACPSHHHHHHHPITARVFVQSTAPPRCPCAATPLLPRASPDAVSPAAARVARNPRRRGTHHGPRRRRSSKAEGPTRPCGRAATDEKGTPPLKKQTKLDSRLPFIFVLRDFCQTSAAAQCDRSHATSPLSCSDTWHFVLIVSLIVTCARSVSSIVALARLFRPPLFACLRKTSSRVSHLVCPAATTPPTSSPDQP